MSTSKQTNHLTINLLENDDVLTYLVEHNMTNEGELYLVEGESDYAQSDWGVTDSADPAYILNKPDLSIYATQNWVENKEYLTSHQDISGKLDTDGDASNVTAAFTAQASRQSLTTGEKLSSLFGKIAKWLSDLNIVAFTGSYNDLSNKPQIPIVTNDLTDALKANYDAAYSHSTSDHAPSTAEENVQSDWNVTDETSDAFILNKPSSLPANGGNADTVDDKHASDFALATDIADMATQTWVGQQGYITAVDSALSATSENPVQNKVITAQLGDIAAALDSILNGTT